MSEFFSPSNLAIGAVLAAAAAGWSHVKTVLSYITSFVVINATLDESVLDYAVILHLKKHWVRLPTGRIQYDSVYLTFKDGISRFVPFRSLTSPSIFVSKKGIVVLTRNKLSSFRFVTDLDQLVIAAMREQDENTRDVNSQRFMVIQCMGSEKTLAVAAFDRNSPPKEDSPTAATGQISGYGSGWKPIERVDKSFMYDDSLIAYHTGQIDPLAGLFFDKEVQKHLDEALAWKTREQWYVDRNVPWRRGTLIYGPGGTGKSSLALVTAKALNVPLYSFVLSTMSDQEFVREWQRLSSPCVVLFEDFDTVFNKRIPLTEHKSLTFDCVLNQISGVKNLNGVYLIVTTNHLEAIDDAMGVVTNKGSISTRPGRIDNVLYLGEASESQRERIVAHILRDWPECFVDMVQKGQGMTPAQFQELCIQYAFKRMAEMESSNVYPLGHRTQSQDEGDTPLQLRSDHSVPKLGT